MQRATTRENELKLHDILDQPLHKQNHAFLSKTRYLMDPDLETDFKKIAPCKPWYYEFMLPVEYVMMRKEFYNAKDLERLSNTESIPMEEAQALLARAIKAVDIVLNEQVSEKIIYNAISALGLLTGRRQVEIAKYASFEPIEDFPYQCIVKDLAKNDNSVFGIKTQFRYSFPTTS
jgi:hypothetical protein